MQLLQKWLLRLVATIAALAVTPVGLQAVPPPISGTGDPHLVNVKSEHFDVMQPGNHTFLVMPRGATWQTAALHLQAEVTARGDVCAGQLYITTLKVAGSWLGDVKMLHFSTRGQALNAPEAVGLGKQTQRGMSVSEFTAAVPETMMTVSQYHPTENLTLNQHATMMTVVLRLGPGVIVRVDWEHQKEKVGFSNWLKLSSWGLGRAPMEVGGLLGEDDHASVMMPPKNCEAGGKASGLIESAGSSQNLGEVAASASRKDAGEAGRTNA